MDAVQKTLCSVGATLTVVDHQLEDDFKDQLDVVLKRWVQKNKDTVLRWLEEAG